MKVRAAALAILASFLTFAQEFEVATIKPADPNRFGIMMRNSPGQMNVTGVTLKMLIQQAYNLKDAQIIGASGWITSDRWDITAKAPDSTAEQALPEDFTKLTDAQRKTFQERRMAMMQKLLADRFQLKTHKETREMPIYTLTVAKGGPKLKDNSGKTSDPNMRPGMMRMSPGMLMASQQNMAGLIQLLSQTMGRTVVDQTGLTGKYDFELKFTPDQATGRGLFGDAPPPPGAVQGGPGPGLPPGVTPPPPPDPNGPTIFTALQEQLGLKLDSGKGPVEVIVIDHAEKATEN